MKTIAFANQKGGVGKTTATYNIAAALTNAGKKVLCIDLDPQHNLSTYMGYGPQEGDITVMDLFHLSIRNGNADQLLEQAIRLNGEGVYYIPANILLSEADMELGGAFMREWALRNILRSGLLEDRYDYCLIDCLPSLGIILKNALVAADSVIIPVQAKKFALDGLDLLEKTITLVQPANPGLEIEAVLVNMTRRTNNSRYIEGQLQERFGDKVLRTTIPDLNEADTSTFMGVSLVNATGSRLGQKFQDVTQELLEREGAKCQC